MKIHLHIPATGLQSNNHPHRYQWPTSDGKCSELTAQQEDRATHVPCHQHRRIGKVIEFYADDDEYPVNWYIQTIPSLAPVRKRLLDEVTPLLSRLIRQYSGSVCSVVLPTGTNSFPGTNAAVNHHDSKSSLLTSTGGHDFNIPYKKKRSHPHASNSSGKRLKPSSSYELEMSTSPIQIALSEMDPEASNADWVDDLGNGDSDSDEDREVVIEEETQAMRLDDKEGIGEYYKKTFATLGQTLLKSIMKAWIKVKEPGKQVKHPYNGGSNPSDDPENPGRDTVPDWWSNQDNWKTGFGCRHKEPDHLGKPGMSSRVLAGYFLVYSFLTRAPLFLANTSPPHQLFRRRRIHRATLERCHRLD